MGIEELKGRTLSRVDLEEGSGDVVFECGDGTRWRMWYEQDCCAQVWLDDIAGDIADLIGEPLLMAEDVSSETDDPEPKEYGEVEQWTFYKLATIKGYVTLRWYGTSNGYYSTSVSFERLDDAQ